jgi:hypothetical protein
MVTLAFVVGAQRTLKNNAFACMKSRGFSQSFGPL